MYPCHLLNYPLPLRSPYPTPFSAILFPYFLFFPLVPFSSSPFPPNDPLLLFLLLLIPLLLLPLLLVLLFLYSSLPPVPHPAHLFYTLCSHSYSAPSSFSLFHRLPLSLPLFLLNLLLNFFSFFSSYSSFPSPPSSSSFFSISEAQKLKAVFTLQHYQLPFILSLTADLYIYCTVTSHIL